MKTCSKCKIEKPFEAFFRHTMISDGYHSSCIECYNSRKLELKNNPLMQLEKQIRSSVIMENKLLKRENKKLCMRCKEIFLIDDLVGGDYCEECNRERIKEYRLKNKEKLRERHEDYSEKNKEKLREYRREYYEKNNEKKREYMKEHRLKNKEKMIEYIEKNKEKIKEYKREYMREYNKKKKLEKQNNN